MSGELTIALSSEESSSGSAEEQATFGLFSITANDRLLTVVEDASHREFRHGPHVSGYPVAEWLLWNWWRMRWEFGRPFDKYAARGWIFAHRMSSIGEGYAWPNITIFSDGLQSFLDSEPSREPDAVLFPYVGTAQPEVVPAANLEAAIDGFVADMLAHLDGRALRDTNLHRLWNDLKTERQDPELVRFRRLEAQLGCDPDEAEEIVIRRRLDDAEELGEEALGEIAADVAMGGGSPDDMASAAKIAEIAADSGFDAGPSDAVALADAADMPQPGEVAAWRVGKYAAQRLRAQERLDGRPISDGCLANFAGTTPDAISMYGKRSNGLSFVLACNGGRARVALRSKWNTGRRFDLARLIGGRTLGACIGWPVEPLLPATRAYSYRQKAQRAFAAELLSPFDVMNDMLGGDYSEERQREVAEHFAVSEMTIRTQLVNHRRIDREDAPDIAGRGGDS